MLASPTPGGSCGKLVCKLENYSDKPCPGLRKGADLPALSRQNLSELSARGYGRSFYRPGSGNIIEDYSRNNHFYHAASDRHYVILQRDGKFFQRRYQLDSRKQKINVFEQEVSYIIGSGNHARSYLHRSPIAELTELPTSWYSQEGSWGMSPGFDQPRHFDFARQIDHGCMFCHNAYPEVPEGSDDFGRITRFPSDLPAGIDCQRCHGPGARHVALASSGKGLVGEIRAAVVTPARLSAERQMDVCMQCHLETTSAPLPHGTRRFARSAYSYRPGEPLGEYMVHFDHAPGAGYDDKFEIVNQAYRLRRSACFIRSQGRLTCTTCHNPHDAARGEAVIAHFRESCFALPSAAFGGGARQPGHKQLCRLPHAAAEDRGCGSRGHDRPSDPAQAAAPESACCSRRAERALQRSARALLSCRSSGYRARPLSCYGARCGRGGSQARHNNAGKRDCAAGKGSGKALVELADAYAAEGNSRAAVDVYRKALALDPRLEKPRYNYAQALEKTGDPHQALSEYEHVLRERPDFAEANYAMANLLVKIRRAEDAVVQYQNALQARPAYAEAHNNLGNVYLEKGRMQEALDELRQAINVEPAFQEAYNNLAKAYAGQGQIDLAMESVRRALTIDPDYAEARLNLGRLLHQKGNRNAA